MNETRIRPRRLRAMRKWCRRGFFASACLALAGCAGQPAPVSPINLALLRAGRPLLTCHAECLAQWRAAQPQAAQLDAAARWQDLAALLASVGYQDDLSLFYLGRAAEGLGYRTAAVRYYRESTAVSGTASSCERLSRLCGGVALPRAAAQRLAAVEHELARARPPRPGPAPQERTASPEMPAAAAEEAETAAPIRLETPAPVATPAPNPVIRPAGKAASEYIEPPPAAR